jgi:hypothetical protein
MKYVGTCLLAATMAVAVMGCDRRGGSGAVVEKTEVAKAPTTRSANDPDVRAVLDAVNSGRATATVNATPVTAVSTDPTAASLRSAEQRARAGQTAVSVGNFNFTMPQGADCRVDVKDNANSGTNHWSVVVTLNKTEPITLTPEAYDRVSNGMTWPQVAQALGGDLAGSQMSAGYTGTVAVAQGMRRIELTFDDGKVTGKTHAGLQWGPTTGPATTSTQPQQKK